jgi:hypothetical protein
VSCTIIPYSAKAESRVGERSSRYHYDDLDRFFVSYDQYMETGDAGAFAPYLEAGSRGLRNFEEHFALTPEKLAARVDKYPAFFASIRKLKPTIQSREGRLDAMFTRLQALFPERPMPEVYFVVGGLLAGGQAGDGNYVMVAGELYLDMPGVDVSELSATSRLFTPDEIVHIVAHEAAHIIQEEIQGSDRYLSIYTEEDKGTLLAYSLREGAANLVAELVSGNHINQRAEAYGLAHEAALWAAFREDAMKTDLGDWFFYQPKTHPEWPRDLGYWMGYRMAARCYEAATDKRAMLLRILDATDPEALLAECAP